MYPMWRRYTKRAPSTERDLSGDGTASLRLLISDRTTTKTERGKEGVSETEQPSPPLAMSSGGHGALPRASFQNKSLVSIEKRPRHVMPPAQEGNVLKPAALNVHCKATPFLGPFLGPFGSFRDQNKNVPS
ncbi:hypothetical protein MTO96_021450 [Rhipicephalus appendiculatus]